VSTENTGSNVETTPLAGASVDDGGFDPFGRDPALAQRIQPLLDFLLDKVFRVQLEGADFLPADGRALLVANHGGALPWDALVLHAALARVAPHRVVRPLVEDAVMTAPFLGTFMTRIGCVRASQDNAVRLLARGEVAAVFPEGMQGLGKLYRRRNKLARFGRGGFVRLAARTHTPLLPVAIVGAEDTAPLLAKMELFFRSNEVFPYLPIMPLFPLLGPLGLLPLPARWRIRIGPPLHVDQELSDANDAVAVGQLASRIRERIQTDVEELVAARGSAFF
jgi:1-acyl-sn-glycerol-3-phosphate acyltransferase